MITASPVHSDLSCDYLVCYDSGPPFIGQCWLWAFSGAFTVRRLVPWISCRCYRGAGSLGPVASTWCIIAVADDLHISPSCTSVSYPRLRVCWTSVGTVGVKRSLVSVGT